MIHLLPYFMVRSLFLTILFETGLALILKVRGKNDISVVVLAQVATNPVLVAVTFAVNVYFGLTARAVCIFILEIAAFVSEGFIYRYTLNYKKINPFLLSLILNVFSYSLGEVINQFA